MLDSHILADSEWTREVLGRLWEAVRCANTRQIISDQDKQEMVDSLNQAIDQAVAAGYKWAAGYGMLDELTPQEIAESAGLGIEDIVLAQYQRNGEVAIADKSGVVWIKLTHRKIEGVPMWEPLVVQRRFEGGEEIENLKWVYSPLAEDRAVRFALSWCTSMVDAGTCLPPCDLYLCDLNGTLISSSDEDEDRNYHAWRLLPHVAAKIAAIRAAGGLVAIVTNQAGVAWNRIQTADVYKKLAEVASALEYRFGVQVVPGGWDARDAKREDYQHDTLTVFVCFGDARAPRQNRVRNWESDRRKPSPAMIREAKTWFKNDARRIVVVGDGAEDQQAADAAGVAFVWAREFFDGK